MVGVFSPHLASVSSGGLTLFDDTGRALALAFASRSRVFRLTKFDTIEPTGVGGSTLVAVRQLVAAGTKIEDGISSAAPAAVRQLLVF